MSKIAVIGLGCRFPGGIEDAASFWSALHSEQDVIGPVPKSRFDADAYYHPDPKTPGRIYSTRGGFLDHIEELDHGFFGIPAAEAERLDPQQRLILEVGFEAYENAGLDIHAQAAHNTGIYVGISHSDYWQQLIASQDPDGPDGYALTGNLISSAAGRLAYLYDLRGPAVSIATACSASLVAVHEAVGALRSGRCDRALAGGVNCIVGPTASLYLCRLGALSASGHCRPFDAAADGYVRSEGCGLLLLERLDDARRAGHRILGLLHGSAVNQDGHSNGITAPNGDAQAAVIRAALADAGMSAEDIDFVETHGTGTKLGDPIEAHALGEVMQGRSAPLQVSAVKSHLGHCESAAGIAGLISGLLTVRHRRLPPVRHCQLPNPLCDWPRLPVLPPQGPQPFATDKPIIGGVSSFGFSGTNVHLIFGGAEKTDQTDLSQPERPAYVIGLSAHSKNALQRRREALAAHVQSHPDLGIATLENTLMHQSRHRWRLAEVVSDPAGLLETLQESKDPREALQKPKIAFLFTGQGSTYSRMGVDLFARFPVFRTALEECDVAFEDYCNYSVRELVVEEADALRLQNTTYAQPALFALEYALFRLWQSHGIEPDVLLGHSIGELVALCVGGVLTLDDAAFLVANRARLMGSLPRRGGMLSVRANETATLDAIAHAGVTLTLAAINSPTQTVVSGEKGALQALAAELKGHGIAAIELKVSHAFHSPEMAPAAAEMAKLAAGIRLKPARIPIAANLTGRVERTFSADYFARQIEDGVRFADGLHTLAAEGAQVFVECGPQPVLLGLLRENLGSRFQSIASMRTGQAAMETFTRGLARAFELGCPVRVRRGSEWADLPVYPYERRRVWIDQRQVGTLSKAGATPELPVETFALQWQDFAGSSGMRTPARDEDSLILEAQSAVDLLTELQTHTAVPGKVVVVTRGAFATSPDLEAAAVWGLARSWRALRPGGRTLLVDVEDGIPALDPVLASPDEDEFRFDSGSWQVPRLAPTPLPAPVSIPRDGGAILISGGLGALGLEIAEALVEEGVEHLVLVGRRAPTQVVEQRLRKWRERAVIDVLSVDITRRSALAEAVAAIPIRGVVHAAGVVEEKPLLKLGADDYRRIVAAKIDGGRYLDELFPNAEPFVIISSLATYLGSADGAYAAANAAVEALVQKRQAAGRHAVAVGFGPIRGAGIGQALDEGQKARLFRIGIGLMDASDAVSILRRALTEKQLAPVLGLALDRRRMRQEVVRPSSPWRSVTGSSQEIDRPSGPDLERAIRRIVAEVLGLRVDDVPSDRPLAELGLDSLLAVDIRDRLVDLCGRSLETAVVFDQPTVTALARHIENASRIAAGPRSRPGDVPLAIVGMDCRLSGPIVDLESFWQVLEQGRTTITSVPASRWSNERWYDPDPQAAGRTYTNQGGFIEDIETFDADFFGVSPKEANAMDPQQRLLLEVGWRALEHAGIAPESLAGSRCGVFVGVHSQGYKDHTRTDAIGTYTATGAALSVAAGRLSYFLGVHGPSLAIDTACSSSLVAFHQACESLRSGDCDHALAAGANLLLSPEETVSLSKLQVLSPNGRCATFGADADGYVRSEACGVVVLKRLDDAKANGDNILAVVRGSAVNHDGRSQGLAAPSGPAQQQVILDALANAGLEPKDIAYVECHGTGTALGDPIEVEALGQVFTETRRTPLILSAVKSNIGHCEAAAGIAGVIKCVLALQHRLVPKSLYTESLNPRVSWDRLPVQVAAANMPLPAEQRPIAGVSSFGFSGTNAHVILESPDADESASPALPAYLLLLSARSDRALRAQAENLARSLRTHPRAGLAAVARTLVEGRSHFAERAAVVAKDHREAIEALQALGRGETGEGVYRGKAEQGQDADAAALIADLDPEDEQGFRKQLEQLAARYVRGAKLALGGFFRDLGAPKAIVPAYPFERERYWHEVVKDEAAALADLSSKGEAGRMLGMPIALLPYRDEFCFEQGIQAPGLRFLADHRVEDATIVPGAAWLESALEAARFAQGEASDGPVELSEVRFERPLVLAGQRRMQVALRADREWMVGSQGEEIRAPFSSHARGRIRPTQSTGDERPALHLPAFRQGLQRIDVDGFYAKLEHYGYHYGPVFRAIRALWADDRHVFAELTVAEADGFLIHPALMDASFQSFAALANLETMGPALPVGVRELILVRSCPTRLFAYLTQDAADPMAADIMLMDENGHLCLQLEGLRVAPVRREDASSIAHLFYEIGFDPADAPPLRSDTRLWINDDHPWSYQVSAVLAKQTPVRLGGHSELVSGKFSDAVVLLGTGEAGWQQLLAIAQHLLKLDNPPRLQIVTRGGAGVEDSVVDPAQAAIFGMARALAVEHPELKARCIDSDGDAQALGAELLGSDQEDQVALYRGRRYVARLAQRPPAKKPLLPYRGEPCRVQVEEPGQLDGLSLVACERRAPLAHEVEIEVEAAGLNFVDVLSVLGVLGPELQSLVGGDSGFDGLGAEGAGRVIRCGSECPLSEGERVLFAAPGSMRRYLTTDSTLVVPYPDRLTAAEAATLPITCATVLYGLKYKAQLEPGERILIHSGTGGIGHAALRYARHIGAEIFATAGSAEKRAYLRGMGVRHISDSRSLQFVEDFRKATDGEGVDVVLNALTGPLLEASFGLLRDHGRFIEIGKRDTLENRGLGMRPFIRNLSFTLVDLIGMMRKRPQRVRALLEETVGLVADGVFAPPPLETLPMEQVGSHFRQMAGARHIGKLIVLPPTNKASIRGAPISPSGDGAYLITGGLGALGLRLGRHLAEQGAGLLVLLGRSPIRNKGQRREIQAIEAAGAQVVVATGDVADADSLDRLVGDLPKPLRGVIHAAGVLGESPFADLTTESFTQVCRAKVEGAIQLDRVTRAHPLDFFIMLASASAVLGSPGQAHYAYANAFLDGLAHSRRQQGLCATSLDLGPVAEIGMAAKDQDAQRFARMGLEQLQPESVLEALDQTLAGDTPQILLLDVAAEGGIRHDPRPFLRVLSRQSDADGASLAHEIAALPEGEQPARLQQWLAQQMAEILGTKPDRIEIARPFSELGLDSLMALDLRNRVEQDLGLTLSATAAISYDSVERLSDFFLSELRGSSGGDDSELRPDLPRDAVEIQELPREAFLDPDIRIDRSAPVPTSADGILLTGATGFLGTFILAQLLKAGLPIHCLVRCRDEQDGRQRLAAAFAQYRLDASSLSEVNILPGDIARERMDLSPQRWSSVAARVDTVIHSAAQVHWNADYHSLEQVNVRGCEDVIRFCAEGHPKTLHYVSTLGVLPIYGALGMRPGGVSDGRDIPELDHIVGYFQTKWVAEQLVLEARRRGLHASIYRPGLIGGDSRTGADSSSAGQFFFSILKGCLQMQSIPRWSGDVRILPVDYVANAIVEVIRNAESEDRDVNLVNHHPMPFTDLVDQLRRRGRPLIEHSFEDWLGAVRGLPKTDPTNILAPFASVFELGSRTAETSLVYFGNDLAADDDATRTLLQKVGARCPEVTPELIDTYLDFYFDEGWFD